MSVHKLYSVVMKLALSYAITPVIINQPFGVNGEYYRANGINILGHNGIDFNAYHGQPVYAPMDGKAYYESDNDAGQGVVIVSDKVFDYKDGQAVFKCILWHLCDPIKEPKYASPIYLALGNKVNSGLAVPVKQGDLVGHADSTGLSSGDHLHFGLKPITTGTAPLSGDAPDVGIGQWVNIEQNNGYLGAIDPQPYFDGTFVATSPGPAANAYVFTRDLSINMTGEDVRQLQMYLNNHGYPVAQSGPGSKGHETSTFGPLTQKAVMMLQAQHGITPVAGYFGPKTRTFVTNNP